MSEIFQRDFDLTLVATATGVKPVTLRSWIAKGYIRENDPLARLTGGGGPGRTRTFGFYSAMQIGIAKAVLDAGPEDLVSAFKAAFTFAHTGDSLSGFNRHPGFPYPNSGFATLLFVSGRRHVILPHDMRHEKERGVSSPPRLDPIAIARAELGRPEGMVVIDCDRVFLRIIAGLELKQSEVFAAVHPKAAPR
jgi:hypothetical protein